MAGLVVFGGESFTHTGQPVYMNDVWLYTPHTGKWRQVEKIVNACYDEVVNTSVLSDDDILARFPNSYYNPSDFLGRA